MSALGFVLPAAALGLNSLLIRPQRGFFSPSSPTSVDYTGQPIVAQAVIEEVHHDELEITDHPVEFGATLSDHAYMRPVEVIIHCAWSNSPSSNTGLVGAAVTAGSTLLGNSAALAASAANSVLSAGSSLLGNSSGDVKDIYKQLLALQSSRLLFDIYTGKRIYHNMVMKSLSVTTDKRTENALWVTASCREIIIAQTQAVTVPINTAAQAIPAKTTPVQNSGQQLLQSASGITTLVQ